MGDARRFHLFAELVASKLPPSMRIADVASGKGYLRSSLYERGYRNVVSWDKRIQNAKTKPDRRWGYFDWRTDDSYDAVIGMHPDGGTDHLVLYAAKHRVPAIICPCCVRPSAEVFWGAHSYSTWCDHLENLARDRGMLTKWHTLPMVGRNAVLELLPAHDAESTP